MTTDKTSISTAKDKNKTRETTKVHFYERMLSRNFARCYFLKATTLVLLLLVFIAFCQQVLTMKSGNFQNLDS